MKACQGLGGLTEKRLVLRLASIRPCSWPEVSGRTALDIAEPPVAADEVINVLLPRHETDVIELMMSVTGCRLNR
jgi:hypothetical protein